MQTLSKHLAPSSLIVAALMAGSVYAMPPGGGATGQPEAYATGYGRHAQRGAGFERKLEQLDLTAEQRGAIRAIVDRTRPQMHELREQMRANREQLRALGQVATLDEGELRRLANVQGQLLADMIVLRTKMRSEINAVLNDEQRRQLEQMREQHHKRRGA